MEYPIPGVYPDIIREIAQKDPETYRKLLLTSKRLGTTIRPVSEVYCNQPISVKEILESVGPIYNFRSRIFPYHPDSDVILFETISFHLGPHPIVIEMSYFQDGRVSSSIERFDRNDLSLRIKELLNEGYYLNIPDFYQILKKRIFCLTVDPRWAIKRTINEIRSRYLRLLEVLATYPPGKLDSLVEFIIIDLFPLLIRVDNNRLDEYRRFPSPADQYIYLIKNFPHLIEEAEEILLNEENI